MTPTEVLKMLKSKIDAAGLNKCNYAIETGDIEAINQALLLYDVSVSLPDDYVPFTTTKEFNKKLGEFLSGNER
jgi:hypothetical protein